MKCLKCKKEMGRTTDKPPHIYECVKCGISIPKYYGDSINNYDNRVFIIRSFSHGLHD